MENPDRSSRRRLLTDSLAVLAADAQTQAAWLIKYGVLPDEIALDFDHAFRMAASLSLVQEGQLEDGVLSDLQEIDAILSRLSGAENADRWTAEALFADEAWSQARRAARRVLIAELGEWKQPLPEISVIR